MKAVFVIVVLVALAALLGWVTFSRDGGRPSATVNTDVVRQDTRKAVEATERAADKVAEGGKRLVEEARRTDIDVDVHRKPAPDHEPAPAAP